MGDIKLLIVGADSEFSNEAVSLMQRLGGDVIAENSGEQALAVAQAEAPQWVVICTQLQDMNGFVLFSKLKKIAGLSRSLFVMVGTEDDQKQFTKHQKLKRSADHYLVKPISVQKLIEILATDSGVDASVLAQSPQKNDVFDELDGLLDADAESSGVFTPKDSGDDLDELDAMLGGGAVAAPPGSMDEKSPPPLPGNATASADLEDTLRTARNEIEQLKSLVGDREAESKRLAGQLKQQALKQAAHEPIDTSEFEQTIEKQDRELRTLQAQLETLQDDRDIFESEKIRLEKELGSQASVGDETDKLRKALQASELDKASFKAQVEQLQKSVEQEKRGSGDAASQSADMQDQLNAANHKVRALQAEMNDVRDSEEAYKAEVSHIEEEYDRLETETGDMREKAKRQLHEADGLMKEASRAREQLDEELNDLKLTKERLQTELEQVEGERNQLGVSLDSLKTDHSILSEKFSKEKEELLETQSSVENKNTDLTERIEKMEAETSSLMMHLDDARMELDSSTENAAVKEKELLEREALVQTLSGERDNLKALNSTLVSQQDKEQEKRETEASSMLMQLDEAHAELDEHRRSAEAALTASRQELKAILADGERAEAHAKEKVEGLLQEKSTIQETLQATKEELVSLVKTKATLEKANDGHEKQITKLEESIRKQDAAFKDEKAELQSGMAALMDDAERLQQTSDGLSDKVKAVEAEKIAMEATHREHTSKLEKDLNESVEENSRLTASLSDQQDDADGQLKELVESNTHLQLALSELEGNLENLNGKLQETERILNLVKSERQEMETTWKSEKETLEKALSEREQTVVKLEHRVDEITASLEKTSSDAYSKQDSLNGVVQKLETEKAELLNVSEQRSAKLGESENKRTELALKLEMLEKEIAQERTEKQDLLSKKSALESSVNRAKEDIERVEASAKADIVKLSKYLKEAEGDKAQLIENKSRLEAKLEKIQASVYTSRNELEDLVKERDLLLEDVENGRLAVEELTEEIESQREEIDEMSNELVSFQIEKAEMQVDYNKKVVTELSQLKSKQKSQSAHVVDLEQASKKMEEEHQILLKTIHESEEKFKVRATKVTKRLKDQVSKLTDELENEKSLHKQEADKLTKAKRDVEEKTAELKNQYYKLRQELDDSNDELEKSQRLVDKAQRDATGKQKNLHQLKADGEERILKLEKEMKSLLLSNDEMDRRLKQMAMRIKGDVTLRKMASDVLNQAIKASGSGDVN